MIWHRNGESMRLSRWITPEILDNQKRLTRQVAASSTEGMKVDHDLIAPGLRGSSVDRKTGQGARLEGNVYRIQSHRRKTERYSGTVNNRQVM